MSLLQRFVKYIKKLLQSYTIFTEYPHEEDKQNGCFKEKCWCVVWCYYYGLTASSVIAFAHEAHDEGTVSVDLGLWKRISWKMFTKEFVRVFVYVFDAFGLSHVISLVNVNMIFFCPCNFMIVRHYVFYY